MSASSAVAHAALVSRARMSLGVIAALAIAYAVRDRAEDAMHGATPARSVGGMGDAAGPIAALLALAAYLVMLPVGIAATGGAGIAGTGVAAVVAVVVWLHGVTHAGARRTRRFLPLWWLLVGGLAGARPILVVPLLPLFFVRRAAISSPRRTQPPEPRRRAWSRTAIVALGGALIGRACFHSSLPVAAGLSASGPTRWLFAALHDAGTGALVLASLSLALVLLGEGRRRLGLCAALLLALEAASGSATALTALALALALGLGLLEAHARLEQAARDRPLPGAALLFAPLVLLALLEPVAARVAGAHFTAPNLGPVPPHLTTAAARAAARERVR